MSSFSTQAALISRTITIDGDTTEWSTATSILTNIGQFSSDDDGRSCPSTDLDTGGTCSVLTPSGRDLKTFAYTWDATNFYIYVARWAATNNVTIWWFYIDTNNDGKLQTGEYVFRVSWRGSNQNTDRVLYQYVESAVGGDPLVNPGGDGYTMPGTTGTSTTLTSGTGGEADQSAMESWLAWSDIGETGPVSLGFHVSSSNSSNIPSSIIDNMDGPSGGSLSFPDLAVTKTVDRDPVWAGNNFTYTVTVTNNGTVDATIITLTDSLPAGLTYVSHVASQGTYVSGTGLWTIGDMAYTTPTLNSVTLTLTVVGDYLASATTFTNTANNLTLNEADPDLANNTASIGVLVNPAPVLTILKSANKANAKPGEIITYTVTVTNTGSGVAPSTVLTDLLSPYVAFGVDAMGGLPFQITDAVPCGNASGLTMGTTDYSNLNDSPRTYGYTPAVSGYDSTVTAWQLPFTGSMNTSGCLALQYKVTVN